MKRWQIVLTIVFGSLGLLFAVGFVLCTIY